MLDENELLTALVHSGSSVLFTKQVARFLAGLPPDDYRFWLQGLNAMLGKAEVPLFAPIPAPPLARSAHEATLY